LQFRSLDYQCRFNNNVTVKLFSFNRWNKHITAAMNNAHMVSDSEGRQVHSAKKGKGKGKGNV